MHHSVVVILTALFAASTQTMRFSVLQVRNDGPMTIDALSDPTTVATSHGLTTKCVVFEKSVGAQSALYILMVVGEKVQLESRVILPHETPKKFEVALEDFLRDWSIFRGVLPSCVSPEVSLFI